MHQKVTRNDDIEAYLLASLYYICYLKDGMERNLEKSFYWFQKIAENGDIEAQYHLAASYRKGEGMEKNLKKAFYWY